MMMSAVAVFEITCPRTAVSTKSPASSARGPKPPRPAISQSASSFAAPVSVMAVESGIIAPTRITVVQLTAR
jgi:hypothetical protein